MRINVDAGGALIEFGEIEDLVNRFFALHGAGMVVIHIVGNTGADATGALRAVLILDAEILHPQFADGDGHPAILPAMVVNAAGLPDFPADGHDFEKIALENQVSCVVALGVEEVRLQRIDAELVLLEVFLDLGKCEVLAMNGGETAHPVIDRHLRHGSLLKSKQAMQNQSISPARAVGVEKSGFRRVL